jgi:demethylmenaquinone methyltransferase/2-methoxy-6-polyprenyl-1,4-benzoquinol methylase
MSRASLDKEPHEVAAMFDGVARHYDRTNTVLSFGQDRSWRRATRRALSLAAGERCLDLAAGTGVSTEELARSGATVVGLDLSLGMLQVGRRARPAVPLLAGDALALPFAAASFDAVTISFGLRNIVDTAGALREMARVTRPGGRLVVCEFSAPVNAAFRRVYLEYLMRALPVVARRVSSNPDAYVYLAESIRAWPDQPALAGIIGNTGWTQVAWQNLTGGIVTLHRAARA